MNDFFGKSGSTDEEKIDNEEEDIPEIPLSNFPDLSSILGISNKDTNEGDVNTDENVFPDFTSIFSKAGATDDEKKCGLLCTLFKNFDTQLKTIEEEVREIRDKEREKENEIDQGDEEENSGPVNEYSEEVKSNMITFLMIKKNILGKNKRYKKHMSIISGFAWWNNCQN